MPSAPENVVDTLALLGILGVELQELGKAQDPVERRAELVAHARQKLALRLVGGRGGLLGLLRALALLALAFVRLDEPGVEPAIFKQQHQEHEARRQQPVDRPA